MNLPYRVRLAAIAATCALAACSSTKLDTDVPVESRNPNAGTAADPAGKFGIASPEPQDARTRVLPPAEAAPDVPLGARSKAPKTRA